MAGGDFMREPVRDFQLREILGHLLRVCQQLHVALWTESFDRNLTSPQFAVLHELSHENPLDQTTLRSRASLDRSTATDIIQRLVRKGWITQHRDPADSRRKLIELTEEGRAAHRAALGPARHVSDKMLNEIDHAERAELIRLLTKVVARSCDRDSPPARPGPGPSE